MNQSFDFEVLCEKFQPKLINSYSNFKRFFHFLLCDLGSNKIFLFIERIPKQSLKIPKRNPKEMLLGIDYNLERLFVLKKSLSHSLSSVAKKTTFDCMGV
jgi:hypothetical protein